MRLLISLILGALTLAGAVRAQTYVLAPDRVFDGLVMHEGWRVRIEAGRIVAAGPTVDESGAQVIRLEGDTLTPGLIDLHSHVFLHPYDETSWNDQVLKESIAERSARAVGHLQATLMAGFTALRDLGTEGAGFADVGMKEALEKGVIKGPQLIVSGPAIVALGSYGPKGFREGVDIPQGAEEASGVAGAEAAARHQIAGGADWVKVYADYRWGPEGEARPTFLEDELARIVEVAHSSGRKVAAHAASDAGVRRAVEAGVSTIEHGDGASLDTFRLMAKKGVALCPTLAATESIARYRGWDGSANTMPETVRDKHEELARALKAGVTICNGSDVGVFSHGRNAWETELLVAYGMTPIAALRAATSIDAKILGKDKEIGHVAPGYVADLAAFEGDPSTDIKSLSKPRFVMRAGEIVRRP
ncbi:MAG: amidohydrolase family protein [Alphaproteobacteria bacterium]|nr:amidohydrolase family protein [Alphaproteobacteria bacterium]